MLDRREEDRDGAFFRSVTNDFATVSYRIGPQHRAYLFQQDLGGVGVLSGSMLALPRMPTGVLETTVDITPFDTSKWSSARVYDIGECSVLLPWNAPSLIGPGRLTTLLRDTVLGVFTGDPRNVGCEQLQAIQIQPVLRTHRDARGRYTSTDAIQFLGSYHCASFHVTPPGGVDITCGDAMFWVDFEVGIEQAPFVSFDVAPMCIDPGLPGGGGVLQFPSDPAFDYRGVVYRGRVGTSCAALVEWGATGMLQSFLPGALGAAIGNAGIVDPRTLGIDETTLAHCTCDADCAGFTAHGGGTPAYDPAVVPRPVCHFPTGPNAPPPAPGGGECWPRLEFDRVLIRPEGLEAVLAEDTSDPQLVLLSTEVRTILCAEGRDSAGSLTAAHPPFPSSDEPANDFELPWPFAVSPPAR